MPFSHLFSFRSNISYSVKQVFAWHCAPFAIERALFYPILKPCQDSLSTCQRKGTTFSLQFHFFGPFWIKMLTECKISKENLSILLLQKKEQGIRGTYQCKIVEVEKGQTDLIEEFHVKWPFSCILDSFYRRLIEKRLSRLLSYKNNRIKQDLSLKAMYPTKLPLRILISGASGFVGAHLQKFLSLLGHDTWRLTRASSATSENEVVWDPIKGIADLALLENFDTVIHLAGENIGRGRWTKKRKNSLFSSRIKGTQSLVSLFRKLKKKPQTFISASAIGIYGDSGKEWVDENSLNNEDSFLGGLCIAWEKACLAASFLGIRTLCARFGMVLSRDGGVLKELIPPFQWGLGGKIGNGEQYISWITLDDLLGAIYHMIMTPNLEGPINCVTPHPLPQYFFAKCLASSLHRSCGPPLSKTVISLLFGQKGKELLLSSTRVYPKRLLESGYSFCYENIKAAFSHII